MPRPAPIALSGVEHVGLVVPDLEAATRFFQHVLGAETLYDVGPFEAREDWMAGHLAGKSGAHIHRMRMVRLGRGPVVEMIELSHDDGSPDAVAPPAGWHLAFYVEDMDAAVAALKAHGCQILSGPVEMTQGPTKGLTWLYFSSPWGQQLELVSYPQGIAAYEGKADVWRPR